MQIEVVFPVEGDSLPTEHHYPLYAALSHAVRDFHDADGGLRFAPINGERGGKGTTRLTKQSRLPIRLPADRIAAVLPLAGRVLQVGERTIRLHTPTVRPLSPVPLLAARIVTFKNATDPVRFLELAQFKLGKLGIAGQPGIPMKESGERAGNPCRRIIRIKGKKIVGYSLQVNGLTAEESLLLQECGLGGRCRMGCGFFVPVQPFGRRGR